MDLNARLQAAWRGDVSGADLASMFAAVAGLSGPQQALEARRLAAQVEQAGHEWRVRLLLGPVAASLWLADALKSLAEDFYTAETDAHPERPSLLSMYTHDLVATLLLPVEDLLAEASAMLADPNHRPPLIAPVRVGPGENIANGDLPQPVAMPYARGLRTAATRVHTSASSTLVEMRAEANHSEAPDWLLAGIRRLDGNLQAAGARLDISERRLDALVTRRSDDPVALDAICRDLWSVVNVAFVAGQTLADPHLLPEAAATREREARPSAPPAPHNTYTAPPAPRSHPPLREEALQLPRIDAGAAPLREEALQLPRIEAGAAPLRERPQNPPPPPPTSSQVPFPVIGESPAPDAPPAGRTSDRTAQKPQPTPKHDDDTPPAPVRFPEIG